MDNMDLLPLLFRGSERILIVSVAALCIFLGYKLFKVVPSQHDGEGKFTLGDLSMSLAKVGPGVFFSMFGAFVLYQSMSTQLEFNSKPKAEHLDNPHLVWMAPGDGDQSLRAERAIGPIKVLNCLGKKAGGSDTQGQRVLTAIHTAKVAIIADVWQPQWGGSAEFAELNMGKAPANSEIGRLYDAHDESC